MSGVNPMLKEFLIDRHRAVFDSGIGWHCVCAEFAKNKDCRHTRESAGRAQAQEFIRNRPQLQHGTLVTFAERMRTENREQVRPIAPRRRGLR
jgi:hypothetical protein